MMKSGVVFFKPASLLIFAVMLAQQAFASSGAMLMQFASRATLTPQASVYGSFVIVNPTNLYIAVRGPSLQTLGVTANAHPHPSLGLYNSSGVLVASSNQCSGSTPDNAAVVNYYSQVRGAPLSANDACLGFVSSALPAGVYSFMITPDSSTPNSSGEVLFETTPGVTGETSSPTGSLSDLYGTMTLRYGFDTSRNYVDQVLYSSANLTSSSGTPMLVGYITGSSTRQITCMVLPSAYNFLCVGSNSNGAIDVWAFNISNNWQISGLYEYCQAGVSYEACGNDAAYTPDGGVIGSISGPGKSPTGMDGQIPSKNTLSLKGGDDQTMQDEKELAKAQPQPALDLMEIQRAVELLRNGLVQ